jgi:hypothetical protein
LRERLTLLLQQRSELQAMRELVTSLKQLPRHVSSHASHSSSGAGSGSSSSEESEFEGPEHYSGNHSHQVGLQPMVAAFLHRTPDSSQHRLHDRVRDGESKGGQELAGGTGSAAPSPSPSPSHALSLEAAAKALHISPEILRQMTTPPKT